MFSVTITEKGGESIVQDFDKDEITIGRIQGNDITLPKSNISKRHAHIILKDGKFEVVDTKSTNGTYINGKRIDAPHELRAGDRIFVGDYTLEVRTGAAGAPPPPPREDSSVEKGVLPDDAWGAAEAGPKEQWADDWAKDDASGAAAPAGATAGRHPGPGAAPAAGRAPFPPPAGKAKMEPVARATATVKGGGMLGADEAGFGPLAPLMQDDMVAQVLVNGPGHVYVERAGKLAAADCALATEQELTQIISRLITAAGGRIDAEQPFADVRLADGSRITAAVPPLAARGPVLTVRKGMREPMQIDDLVAFGMLNAEMAGVLETCIKARVNVVVCGAPGAGLTTTLNVLTSFIPADERIVTIEERAELKLEQPDVVSLEGRHGGATHASSMTDLMRAGLRLRPDRLVIDECMGSTPELLQAFASGCDGCIAAVRASGPEDALSRLEAIVLAGSHELQPHVVRAQLAIGVGLVVHQARLADGARRVMRLSEIAGIENGALVVRDLFVFEQRGLARGGRVTGGFRPTGTVPRVYEQLRASGAEIDVSVFKQG